jgi:hypothetical protein
MLCAHNETMQPLADATYVVAVADDSSGTLNSAKRAFGAFRNDGVISSCDLYLKIPTNEAYAAPSLTDSFMVSRASAM